MSDWEVMKEAMGPSGELYVAFSMFVFFLGLCIGSFLNVVIWRVPLGESVVTAPSHCPKCNHKIRWFENIPVMSWIMLRGKCSSCTKPIPIRYPMVELITGLLWLFVWVKGWVSVGGSKPFPMIIMGLFLASLLVAITYIDIDHMIIPDSLNLLGFLVGITAAVIWPETHDLNPDAPPGSLFHLSHMPSMYYMVQWIMQLGSWLQSHGIWVPEVVSHLYQHVRLTTFLHALAGAILGGGSFMLLTEFGKLLLGRKHYTSDDEVELTFTEDGYESPLTEFVIWEDLLVRERDRLRIKGRFLDISIDGDKDGEIKEQFLAQQSGEILFSEEAVVAGEASIPFADFQGGRIEASEWWEPREAMGYGDVKMMGMLGAILGPGGVIFVTVFSSFFGSIFGVFGMILSFITAGRHNPRMPFGPFIALAAILYVLVGSELIMGYGFSLRWFSSSP